MKLIVYHGSNDIINKPKHHGGRRFSDFGLGFYVTTNIEMAKRWSCRKGAKNSCANKYMFNVDGLSSLTFDLDLNWLLFIAYNRRLIANEELEMIFSEKYRDIDKYDIDKEYYVNETKQKKIIMENKMKFIRNKFGNVGKYFDELRGNLTVTEIL